MTDVLRGISVITKERSEVSNPKRAFPATPNQHRSVLCGSEALADVPGHCRQFSDYGCRSERVSNRYSLGTKHKPAPPCLQLRPWSRRPPRDREMVHGVPYSMRFGLSPASRASCESCRRLPCASTGTMIANYHCATPCLNERVDPGARQGAHSENG